MKGCIRYRDKSEPALELHSRAASSIGVSSPFQKRADKKIMFVFHYRDVFMEKHWKSVISRSVCDYFFDAQNKATRFVTIV